MPIVDRLEYPKKYKMKGTLLLLVILAALGGIVGLRLSGEARAKRIVVHSVGFDEYDRNFIRVKYEIENKGRKTEQADLLIKVFVAAGEEIARFFYAFIEKIEIAERLNQGLKVVICGRPNVGKSTLMNVLLGEDRAIVSEIPGTTRDYLSEPFLFHGLYIRLFDTAGLRQTRDTIEKIGIRKTMELID